MFLQLFACLCVSHLLDIVLTRCAMQVRYGEESTAHGRKRRVVEYNPFAEHPSVIPPAFLEAVERREGQDMPVAPIQPIEPAMPVEPALPEVEGVDRGGVHPSCGDEVGLPATVAGAVSSSRGDEAGPSAPIMGGVGGVSPARVDVVPRVSSSESDTSSDEGVAAAREEIDFEELFGLR
jgi:hypothetical protein